MGILGLVVIGVGIYLLNNINSKDVEELDQAQTELTTISEKEGEEFKPTSSFSKQLNNYWSIK